MYFRESPLVLRRGKSSDRTLGRACSWWTAALVAGCVLACADSDSGDDGIDDPRPSVPIAGAIAKGPFIAGSRVDVSTLDVTTLLPTGESFRTDTINVLGEFELTLQSGPVDVQTSGFYFNELTAQQSAAAIELRAIVDVPTPVTDKQSLYVNTLTHLARRRALHLATDGDETGNVLVLVDAIDRAESEVRAELTNLIAPVSPSAAANVSLLEGNNADTAYLLALSCIVIQAALDEAVTALDAAIQRLLNDIALDLEEDGELQPSVKAQLIDASRRVDASGCRENTASLLLDAGVTVPAPDPHEALDYDGDGIPNANDDDADGDGFNAASDRPEQVVFVQGHSALVRDSSGQIWGVLGPNTHTILTQLADAPGAERFASTGELSTGQGGALAFGRLLVRSFDGQVRYWNRTDEPAVVVSGLPSTGFEAAWATPAGDEFVMLGFDGRLYRLTEGVASRFTDFENVADYAPSSPDSSWLMERSVLLLDDGTLHAAQQGGPSIEIVAPPTVPVFVQVSVVRQGILLLDSSGGVWRVTAIPEQCMLEPPSPDEACTFSFDQLAFPGGAAPAKALNEKVALLEDGQVWDVSGNPQPFFDLENVVAIDVSGESDNYALIDTDGRVVIRSQNQTKVIEIPR